MNRVVARSSKYVFGCGLALTLFVPIATAYAQNTTLYSFTGGNDGGNPPCGLISGGKGVPPGKVRFFGATYEGGTGGYGTVYEVENTGFETVLYSFTGGSDGNSPQACPITDATGNFYGTTEEGGTYGYGVVYKLTPGGTETVLHSFTGGTDGGYPFANLVMDASGNLYGTTVEGGGNGLGVVFEVSTHGTESVLYSFGGSDGAYPRAGLVMDKAGNFYGTTEGGGAQGLGVVFKVTSGGTEIVLHSFAGGSDGATPVASVTFDKAEDLYGTTLGGGTSDEGTVFKISHKGKEAILHSFTGGSDGSEPFAGVVKKGAYLYGTTFEGGASDFGTVFKLPAKGGDDTVLYSFTGGSDGGLPDGTVLDQGGNLFGTTFAGGDPGCTDGEGCGVVFEITP
ncbi:MAG TPA: choice-of-anchor tandem repeat GloVer-containing protein [Rhizomicrobium sp.]|nr:choice-of-anchor tandem repeat GloVer-containing protein [Rhizomicrobium sp.]